jgi:hypothetical protein
MPSGKCGDFRKSQGSQLNTTWWSLQNITYSSYIRYRAKPSVTERIPGMGRPLDTKSEDSRVMEIARVFHAKPARSSLYVIRNKNLRGSELRVVIGAVVVQNNPSITGRACNGGSIAFLTVGAVGLHRRRMPDTTDSLAAFWGWIPHD